MKLLLFATVFLSWAGLSRAAEQKASPAYITANQVKIYWYNQLPAPRPLAKDYAQQMASRSTFVHEVQSGKYDLQAQQTAANYNKILAIKAGDIEAAKLFESELVRIGESILAEKKLAQEKQIAESQRALIQSIHSQLEAMDRTMLPEQN